MKKAMIIAVCGITASTQAAIITQSQSYSGIPNYDQAFTFNTFDTGLGSLISVEVTLSLDVYGGFMGVDNDGVGPATVNVEFGAAGSLSSSDVNLFPSPSVTSSNLATFNLAGDDGDGVGVQTTGADYDQLTGVFVSNSSSAFINSAFFGDYEGAGLTYDILASISQIIDFGGVSGVAGEFSPQTADLVLTVVYNYTPIPTPAGAMVLGMGGLFVARRRRA